MNYKIIKEIPEYAIEDCKSLNKCAECCGYRLPLALAYTLYHRWSEDIWCAGWEDNIFDCFIFVRIINFLQSDNWENPIYDCYTIVDDGSYPINLLEDPDELYFWIMKINEE